jgi:hypothetical protein
VTTPPKVTALGFVITTAFANTPAPFINNTPLFVASPSVIVPDSEYPFVNVRSPPPAAALLESVPPVIVSVPVPNPALFPTRTVPPPIVTPPVNVFTPLNVVAPVPPRTNPPVPLITPESTPVVAVPPTVSVDVCKFTAPLPLKLPIVSFAPSFNTPGEFTVTTPVSTIAAPPFNVSVPPVTVVVPVWLFAPAIVNSPTPAFVKFPVPLKTPFQFTALNTVTVDAAVIAPAPPNVNAPLFDACPNVTFAPMVNPFANVRATAESLDTATLAVFNVNTPLPSAVSLPT